jgi:ribokinase
MSRPRIIVIGSSNTDLVVRAGRIPAPGETVLGSSYMTAAGGKGANQAVAAARLGADVTFVARIGADTFGDVALDGFAREGICTDFVMRDQASHSGVALIVVDDHGENAIAVAPGANGRMTEEDVDRARDCIAEADGLLLQLETPLAVVHHAAAIAREAGVPTILNPAPARSLSPELLRAVSVLTPNQAEAECLTGIPVRDTVAARRAAEALRAAGVPAVVVTLGASGAQRCTRLRSRLR